MERISIVSMDLDGTLLDSHGKISRENREALRVAAASARISTQQGTALEIFENSLGDFQRPLL